MLVALLFHSWQGLVLGKTYPYCTFLSPYFAFTDFTDVVISANLPNPYIVPTNDYLPFTYLFFRLVALFPKDIALVAYIFFSLAGFALLLIKALENIVDNPWLRVGTSLLLIGLSYPILMGIDRGNTDMILAVCIAASIYYYSKGRYSSGTLWLLPTICCKPFMLLFLIFPLRQRKHALIVTTVVAFLVITAFSAHFFTGSPQILWDFYKRNMAYHIQNGIYENNYLDESSSPWVMYKLCLVTAGDMGFISPVDFDWDGAFILGSYAVYMKCILMLAICLTGYVCFIEKEFQRCAILALLFLPLAVPLCNDYRIVYVAIALALLIPLKKYRPGDYLAVVLLACVLVPKKEIFVSFSAYPTTNNITLQVFLNPIFMMVSMAALIYGGWLHFDFKWTKLRFQRFVHSIPIIGPRWS